MAHDSHDRRTALEIGLGIDFLFGGDGLGDLGADIFGLEAELFGHDIDCLGIEALVDRHHDSEIHACSDDIVNRDVHQRGKLVGGHKFGEFQRLALGGLAACFLTFTRSVCLALLLAPFGAFLAGLVLGGETCESLLDLLLDIVVAHLNMSGSLFAAVLFVGIAVASAALVIATTALIATAATTL